MKRYKFSRIITSVFILVLTFGCKTLPKTQKGELSPLDLLDSNSAFYLKIPADMDSSLTVKVLQSVVDELNEGDARELAIRLEVIYAGLYKHYNDVTFQIAAVSNIPQKYLPYIFKKKDGWEKEKIMLKKNYNIYSREKITLAFPDKSLTVAGRNVREMLNVYDTHGKRDEPYGLRADIKSFLQDGKNEIRFYALRAQSFLTNLTGVKLNLKLKSISGNVVKNDAEDNGGFLLNMNFSFEDEQFVKIAKAALKLAFSLSENSITQVDALNIKIEGIQIDEKNIKSFLSL